MGPPVADGSYRPRLLGSDVFMARCMHWEPLPTQLPTFLQALLGGGPDFAHPFSKRVIKALN